MVEAIIETADSQVEGATTSSSPLPQTQATAVAPVMMTFQGESSSAKVQPNEQNSSDTQSAVEDPIIVAPAQSIINEKEDAAAREETKESAASKTIFPKERLDLRRMRPQSSTSSNTHPTVSTPAQKTAPQKQTSQPAAAAQQHQEESKDAPSASSAAKDETSIFECNICLETAKEPVVSKCGHLYCWACIYQWMQQPRDVMVCPVCKSGISTDSVIPIYTRENNEDPRKKQESSIPGRPQGSRSQPEPNRNRGNGIFGGGGGNAGGFVMGFGIFPTLFSLNFTWDDITGGNGGANRSNAEDVRQQQLQHFLGVFLMFLLFSFVSFGSDVFLTF